MFLVLMSVFFFLFSRKAVGLLCTLFSPLCPLSLWVKKERKCVEEKEKGKRREMKKVGILVSHYRFHLFSPALMLSMSAIPTHSARLLLLSCRHLISVQHSSAQLSSIPQSKGAAVLVVRSEGPRERRREARRLDTCRATFCRNVPFICRMNNL